MKILQFGRGRCGKIKNPVLEQTARRLHIDYLAGCHIVISCIGGVSMYLSNFPRLTNRQIRWLGLTYLFLSLLLLVIVLLDPILLERGITPLRYLVHSAGWGFLLAHVFVMINRYRTMKKERPDWLLPQWVLASVFAITNHAAIFTLVGIKDSTGSSPVSHEFVDGLYFSLATWTALGYGDLQPLEYMRLMSSSLALMGYITMAMFIGFILGGEFSIREKG